MSHAVVHFEIGAQDAIEARDFYGALFGWSTDTADPRYAVVAASDGGIGGGITQLPNDVAPYVTVYVEVQDLHTMLARAEELGAIRAFGPTTIPNIGEVALFTDPDGHLIGLFSSRRSQ